MSKVVYQVRFNDGEIYITTSFNDAVRMSREYEGRIKVVYEEIKEEKPKDYKYTRKHMMYREKFAGFKHNRSCGGYMK